MDEYALLGWFGYMWQYKAWGISYKEYARLEWLNRINWED